MTERHRMGLMIRAMVAIVGLAFSAPIALGQPFQNRWYVDASAAPGGDGSTWGQAFAHLQDALAAAFGIPDETHEIWVAAGTYHPDRSMSNPQGSGDPLTTFDLLGSTSIFGGFSGGETDRNQRDPTANTTI